jgi:BirA family biotin operon repressor/biotin-[acetyl-CoA-carboxylase] ligase
VYINDSKAAGILIENSLKGNKWQWAVIGIGVNINQTTFDTSLTNPTSVAAITGQQYHTIDAAKQLCSFLNIRYHQLLNGETENLLNTYNGLLYKKNQAVKLKKNNIAFNCIIRQVNAMGKLQVKDGLQDEFDFGEVEWILPNPAL